MRSKTQRSWRDWPGALVCGGRKGGAQEALEYLLHLVKRAYSSAVGENEWLVRTLPAERLATLRKLDLLPAGIDPAIRETMHRTHMGVDADPLNLLLGCVKCSLADFVGMDIASNLSDILLGVPSLTFSQANLGVLDAEAVNVAVHGHNPLISESIIEAAGRFESAARSAGAAKGVNIVGVCCTFWAVISSSRGNLHSHIRPSGTRLPRSALPWASTERPSASPDNTCSEHCWAIQPIESDQPIAQSLSADV